MLDNDRGEMARMLSSALKPALSFTQYRLNPDKMDDLIGFFRFLELDSETGMLFLENLVSLFYNHRFQLIYAFMIFLAFIFLNRQNPISELSALLCFGGLGFKVVLNYLFAAGLAWHLRVPVEWRCSQVGSIYNPYVFGLEILVLILLARMLFNRCRKNGKFSKTVADSFFTVVRMGFLIALIFHTLSSFDIFNTRELTAIIFIGEFSLLFNALIFTVILYIITRLLSFIFARTPNGQNSEETGMLAVKGNVCIKYL